ncbi:MAG: 16S/23S rRNA (cytidine-2'-O)-methyltransferase TlyA [Alphaproteobacteria bacterium MarineAlpha9_Bin4]|nr:TlyA family rRNA (cytidine-2'-O)-methyltransferase [Pelagibacterales bacterium]PPR26219.1 MAG: 16S/23S rRNA (cytidine-2'-O)-methyltransferase TlyA [Alphaproteobacteria bacterium MarineAlpha9_Bin4]
MKEKFRLDNLLVLNKHAENVNKAKALVMSGKVLVNDMKIDKPGTKFTNDVIIRIIKKSHNWVSRGGIKLEHAINKLNIKIENRICADLGSSTGGFTEVLLSKKARQVYSVDVGKGLLDWRVLTNKKVTLIENTNVRKLALEDISSEISFITCDLSFISLTKGLEKIIVTKNKNISILALIKPQFELSKDMIGKKGVVTNKDYRKTAITKIISWFEINGWIKKDIIASPITGMAGNKEYFIYCVK